MGCGDSKPKEDKKRLMKKAGATATGKVPECKVVFLGDANVGKSSMFQNPL